MGYKVKFERGSVRDAEMDREQWKRSWKRSDRVALNFLVHYVAQVITQITQIACPTTSLTVVCTNRCGLNTLYYFDISKQKKSHPDYINRNTDKTNSKQMLPQAKFHNLFQWMSTSLLHKQDFWTSELESYSCSDVDASTSGQGMNHVNRSHRWPT